MTKPLEQMSVEELLSPFGSLRISHPYFGGLADRAIELARRNALLVEALSIAADRMRGSGKESTIPLADYFDSVIKHSRAIHENP